MFRGLLLVWALVSTASAWAVADDATVPVVTPPPEHFELLFLGNSHSAANDLPGMVTKLITAGVPGAQARSALAPGYRYLDERLTDGQTQPLLDSRAWTHVILQAQKYSSSGQYYYPTDAAEEWIRRTRAKQAEPVLFPEWPRRGNTEEGLRVHELHLSIAAREPACVAPIGLAWEQALARYPQLKLHASDGNHANPNGSLLTAFVLYQVIAGLPASALPFVPSVGVDASTQQNLREVASETIEKHHQTCLQAVPPPAPGASVFLQPLNRIPTLGTWGTGALVVALLVTGIYGLALRMR
jgi:hypothetical protein